MDKTERYRSPVDYGNCENCRTSLGIRRYWVSYNNDSKEVCYKCYREIRKDQGIEPCIECNQEGYVTDAIRVKDYIFCKSCLSKIVEKWIKIKEVIK